MEIRNLEPREVFTWFEKIAAIPHGSGNTKELADFIIEFAKERNLRVKQDTIGNVAVFKVGSKGREGEAALMLQGHIDMVCEKTPDADIDMAHEAITLCTNGSDVWAKDTTLGGDDGIAVAYMLAILDSDRISHPPVECLFTVDEEVGLVGAAGLEITGFEAKRLINLDSEEEGILTVSCAGAARVFSSIPMKSQASEAKSAYRVTISGLKGGHSGVDINKHRQNAIVLMGRLLSELIDGGVKFQLADVCSGGRDNVIPSSCEAVLVTDSENCAKQVDEIMEVARTEISFYEEGLKWSVEEAKLPDLVLDAAETEKLAFILYNIPDGMQVENPEIPGMTRTSLNSGSLELVMGEVPVLKIGTMIRSNLDCERLTLIKKLRRFITCMGGEMEVGADYPAWPYASKSPLRDHMVSVYTEMYGKEPQVSSIHAGLECGILTSKLGELDMVSIGPDLSDVHSPKETMNVGSVQRTWDYLLEVLKAI